MLKESKQNFLGNPDQLVQWKNSPVILASGSALRLDSLKKLGFQNVTTFPMPDDLEKNINQELIENKFSLQEFNDPYSAKIPEYVAEAKLNYLISQNEVPQNSLLISLDTLAMAYRYNKFDLQNIKPIWTAHHFPKVDNIKELRKIILSNFHQLGIADTKFNETLGGIKQSPESMELRKYGYLTRLIEVNTGIALRLPYQEKILTTSVNSRLELHEVLNLKGNNKKLDQLVDDIFRITFASGRDPLKISGGIDYSNPKIFKLLKAREVSLFHLPSPEKGIYLGFPEEYFLKFISSLDKNVI